MNKKEVLGIFFVLVVILVVNVASALDYCVDAVVTDISPSSIGIDEEFTIGILLDSCGNLPSEKISFEFLDLSENIYVKEPLIKNITSGYVGDRFLLYHMKASDNITPGEYSLKYKLKYSGDGDTMFLKEGNFSVTIIGDEAKLNIASVKIDPVIPRKGNTIELTLRIENFGDGDANSIKIKLDHPFEGIKESYIGTLESDEDGPAIFTFIVNKKGEFEFPIEIDYEDDFGKHKIVSKLNLSVIGADTNWVNILLIFFVIIIIVAFIFYYLKTKEEKEKIIEQVLKGNNNNTKVKEKEEKKIKPIKKK